jgi:hypothetical protein
MARVQSALRAAALALCLAAALTASSCSGSGDSGFYAGETISDEQLEAYAARLAAADTEKYPEQTDSSGNVVYFWTPGGKVCHVSPSCPSLSSSPEILQGTREEAEEAGKTRVCSVCGARD